MWTVIDNIVGEIITFTDQYGAESEAQRRLSLHINGYNIRRNHVEGCNAIMVVREKDKIYEICLEDR